MPPAAFIIIVYMHVFWGRGEGLCARECNYLQETIERSSRCYELLVAGN